MCAAGEDLITTPPPSDGDNTSQVLCDTALAVSVLDPGGHPVLEYPHPTVYSTAPPTKDGDNTPTTHLAFYTTIWLIFFDLEFSDVTSIEFHGDSESAISFGI